MERAGDVDEAEARGEGPPRRNVCTIRLLRVFPGDASTIEIPILSRMPEIFTRPSTNARFEEAFTAGSRSSGTC